MNQTWLVWQAALAPQICDYITNKSLEFPAQEASIGFSGDIHPDESYRKSTIRWVQDPVIASILLHYATEANKVWNFDISAGVQEIQFTQYALEGKYEWHHDVDWRSPVYDRKLSVVVQLSDNYEGGEFEFRAPADSLPLELFRPKGSVLVFPSFYEHKVYPITAGERNSLVSWIAGPKYR